MSKLTFEFFCDGNGRLRCRICELDKVFPVESKQGKRYKFGKCSGGLYPKPFGPLKPEDYWRLQTAQPGDIITIEF